MIQIKQNPENTLQIDDYPYIGFMLQGKNAIEVTNCEAEGDNLSLSFNWYETAVHTKDLKP